MRSLHRDEAGASAVLVGIVITVLLGLGALVLDIGNFFWERRMQQNAADSAALAAAQDYVLGADDDTARATAQAYASQNNPRGVELVEEEFETPEDRGESEVGVTVQTGDEDGNTGVITPFLGGVLSAGAGEGRTIPAQAVASFDGVPTAGIPLTGSLCDFYDQDDYPESLEEDEFEERVDELPAPDEIIDEDGSLMGDAEGRVSVDLHDNQGQGNEGQGNNPDPQSDVDECTVHPGFTGQPDEDGDDTEKLPGGFGWLEEDGDDECAVDFEDEGEDGLWIESESGNNPDGVDCVKDALGEKVALPIYQGFDEDRRYEIYAVAAFLVTGYDLPGESDAISGENVQCDSTPGEGSGLGCVVGYFVGGTLAEDWADPDDTALGDAGLRGIRLTE